MSKRLHELTPGEKGRIVGFEGGNPVYRQKLLAMGLTPDTEFTVIRFAPLGDPIEIHVRGFDLSLRREEIDCVKVERLANEAAAAAEADEASADFTIAVVGNPNSGKTTIFNGLTGARQRVGNWPGVTVEKKTGRFSFRNRRVEVVDLPGLYSLDVREESVSLDEQIARDYILSGQADLVVDIVDASNLERNLYLTVQLLEMKVPLLVILNMMDILEQRGAELDAAKLSERLGALAVPVIGTHAEGMAPVKPIILRLASEQTATPFRLSYPDIIEQAIARLQPCIERIAPEQNARWLALKLLEGDAWAAERMDPETRKLVTQQRKLIEELSGEGADLLIADSRYRFIRTLIQETLTEAASPRRPITDVLDRVVLNRWLGLPIFLGVMYLMFFFAIQLGRAFKPFFNLSAQALFVDGFGAALTRSGLPEWITALLADGLGNGIREVIAFVPIIAFLYIFISLLEDSGYMTRAAFVMDRFMGFLGLPGKSFIPMVVAFGCNVPAVMACRTLERPRDRILTILMIPFLSCGARLPVYVLFAEAFFPRQAHIVVFGLYLTGIAFAILTGLIMKNTLLKQKASFHILEMPPYHTPRVKNVWLNTWQRVKAFIFKAGKFIVPMVMLIQILNSFGADGTFPNRNVDRSVLSAAGRTLTPAFEPMGISEENWPATVALFTGVLHKVVVIGTLEAIYTQASRPQRATAEFDLLGGLRNAVATIPAKLSELFGIGPARNQAVPKTRFVTEMKDRFTGPAAAFAYLLFVLLYFPCITTTVSVFREGGRRWALFLIFWTTGLAYMTATAFYQAATYAQHPASSVFWLSGFLALFVIVVWLFHRWGDREASLRTPV
ncbi:Fe(2+) transporter permease subunit FeoB [Methylocaldum sp. 14B]|uniref:Fe(2+) transporter permease subunit FeoB n=1 Tax=Methylocaldum sp. 14B TaxID=1912213 RepID=UPI00098A94D0|nr:Fe(2+) transporter permease subunit FeoB [Methylocaldum sp. 14B]